MTTNLKAVDTAFKNPPSLLVISNNFERIARAEKDKWQPYYYAALFRLNYVFVSQKVDEGDAQADKADELLAKADSLFPGNCDITLAKAMSNTVRLLVDPMNRYMAYGTKSEMYVQQAMKQDSANPRPFYFKGTLLKNTPEQFGGGCKTALPYLLKAKERFVTFKSDLPFYPNWGNMQNEQTIEECKK